MSHYAQIVERLGGFAVHQDGTGPKLGHVLDVGTEVKCVELVDGGYRCHARVGPNTWIAFETSEDLPAFTDKGRAHRERQVAATLRKGRPPGGGSHQERAIAFRPTTEQRAWLQASAEKKRTTMSKLVREALIKLGMPS